jgi:hypothetical protein
MANFLRDLILEDYTIDEACIRELDSILNKKRLDMPEQVADLNQVNALLFYTIRFDGKGYRTFFIEELLNNFRNAKNVERVVCQLESLSSMRSNRSDGSYIELRLDNDQNSTSHIIASSDTEAWMNNGYSDVAEALEKRRNRNGIFRRRWVVLFIQLFGLFVGFTTSLWAASSISASLSIENSFLISFIIVLLAFSNLWGHLNQIFLAFVSSSFPKICFDRPSKDSFRWLFQAVVAAIVCSGTLFALNKSFLYIGQLLGGFLN